jgi:hypothetical protein
MLARQLGHLQTCNCYMPNTPQRFSVFTSPTAADCLCILEKLLDYANFLPQTWQPSSIVRSKGRICYRSASYIECNSRDHSWAKMYVVFHRFHTKCSAMIDAAEKLLHAAVAKDADAMAQGLTEVYDDRGGQLFDRKHLLCRRLAQADYYHSEEDTNRRRVWSQSQTNLALQKDKKAIVPSGYNGIHRPTDANERTYTAVSNN